MSPDTNRYPYDVFISHASEDKNEIVDSLAQELRERGLRVWYDEDELSIGDSIRESIDKGLRKSEYVVGVLSEKYFEKHWTMYELDGALAQESEQDGKNLLPLWYEIEKEDVRQVSPPLADQVAARISQDNVSAVAREIALEVRDEDSPDESGSEQITPQSPSTKSKGTTIRARESPFEIVHRGPPVQRIDVGHPVGIFRSTNYNGEIVAETEGHTISLGTKDMTVSRKSDGIHPVVFHPRSDGVLVCNISNNNEVEVETEETNTELPRGGEAIVRQTALVSVGYNTELLLTPESDLSF